MALFEGLIIGVLAGLLLRPFLDAYLIHQQITAARREAQTDEAGKIRTESRAQDASP